MTTGAAGNRLLLNLRGEAARLAEELEPQDLVDDDDIFDDPGKMLETPVLTSGKGKGWRRLIRPFAVAFPEGRLRELPRVYRDFPIRSKCMPGSGGAMDRYINELKSSKSALEKADTQTSISDGIFGFSAC